LAEQKVRIALTLDPIFMHQHILDSLHTTQQVEQLHATLDLIRKTVSTATDEALASSVRDLPVRPKLCEWALRWLKRMDRPLVAAPLADDPDFMPLYGAALARTARKYRNCLAQRVVHSAVGKHCYLEYLPEPGGIVELTRLTNGWVATEIDAAGRGDLTSQTLGAIQSKLAQHRIPSFAPAVPAQSVRALARLLGSWELMHEQPLLEPPDDDEQIAEELAA
jgi:hypothetical protein